MRINFLLLFALFITCSASAQDDLFGTPKREARKGFVIAVYGNFDLPAADMAKRFGASYRVGPSVFFKTKSNWMIGVKGDFILGNKIKEEGFMSNLKDARGNVITAEGFRTNVGVFERGYAIGFLAGKTINISKTNPDNGITLTTSAGFIQHKISITTKNSGYVPQLDGDYKKGYDRLTNGWFVEQYVGYSYFSNNSLVNFSIGFNFLAGFTAGRRDYLFDVQKPGTDSRLDILWGIRGGWFIPIFHRKSEEFYFD
ncbi:MAG: hypothetical protein JST52_07105 [Bacteroidetes bacterium]|nr:hypothetical protein [Bacteroidota bacterium]